VMRASGYAQLAALTAICGDVEGLEVGQHHAVTLALRPAQAECRMVGLGGPIGRFGFSVRGTGGHVASVYGP
jgi:hypothetical protein